LSLGAICIALWIAVFTLGCLTAKNRRGIGREVFVLATNGLVFLQLVALALLDIYSESLQALGLFSLFSVIVIFWSAFTGYMLARVAVSYVLGAIGKRAFGLLAIIPIANLMLAILPISSPRKWRLRPTLRLLIATLGALTLNVATGIGFLVPAMTSGWRLFA
jgi:hypothetical protein